MRPLLGLLWLTLHQVCAADEAPQFARIPLRFQRRAESAQGSGVEERPHDHAALRREPGLESPRHYRGAYLLPRADAIFGTSETVVVSTSVAPNGTVQILPTLSDDKTPHTTGTVATSLETGGRSSVEPILTSVIPEPQSTLTATGPASPVVPKPKITMASNNIFADPIATSAPPGQIGIRSDHPVPRKGVKSTPPLQTNKFYANFYLGDQTYPSYTHPYAVAWVAGKGATGSWGLSVSHVDATQRVFGGVNAAGAAAYFINPVGIQSVILSAKELGSDTALTTDSMTAFSARVHLRRNAGATPDISFPLVQGMGCVTGEYNGATPLIQTGVYFRTVTKATQPPGPNIAKYTLVLEDGRTWRVYGYSTTGAMLDLQVLNNGLAQATAPFYGAIQVCKDTGDAEAIYDQAAGIYATGLELSGSADGVRGSYTFTFKREGKPSGLLLMYALPHHVESFDDATRAALQGAQLQTTTKGVATAILADQWTMIEPAMPIAMTFAPWSRKTGSLTKLSANAKATIRGIAAKEVSQNMFDQANLDSMYFSGKVGRDASLEWLSLGFR